MRVEQSCFTCFVLVVTGMDGSVKPAQGNAETSRLEGSDSANGDDHVGPPVWLHGKGQWTSLRWSLPLAGSNLSIPHCTTGTSGA